MSDKDRMCRTITKYFRFLLAQLWIILTHTHWGQQTGRRLLNQHQTNPSPCCTSWNFCPLWEKTRTYNTWMYKYPNRISYNLQLENGLSGDSGHISIDYRTASERESHIRCILIQYKQTAGRWCEEGSSEIWRSPISAEPWNSQQQQRQSRSHERGPDPSTNKI
jgi:hypothetical protein